MKVDAKTRGIIERYPSVSAAARANGLDINALYYICHRRSRPKGGAYFRFEDDFDPAEDLSAKRAKGLMLTDREKQVLAFTMSYIEEEQKAPTLAEIAAFLDVSGERARQLVSSLETKGFVRREYHKRRGLEVTICRR